MCWDDKKNGSPPEEGANQDSSECKDAAEEGRKETPPLPPLHVVHMFLQGGYSMVEQPASEVGDAGSSPLESFLCLPIPSGGRGGGGRGMILLSGGGGQHMGGHDMGQNKPGGHVWGNHQKSVFEKQMAITLKSKVRSVPHGTMVCCECWGQAW